MNTRLKLAASTAVVLVAIGALSRFFHWMNQPSDLWFYAGDFGVLSVLVLAPGIVTAIWRARFLTQHRP